MESQLIPGKALFRPSEVAQIIGVSTRTVYRYMASGDFGELWMGKALRITRQGLMDFLTKPLENWDTTRENERLSTK